MIIDAAACIIDIKKGPKLAGTASRSVFKHSIVGDVVKREALMRPREWVAENGIDAPGPFRACRDLLSPSRSSAWPGYAEADGRLSVAREWVTALDHSVLPIQGPPGAGKTYTGARMITLTGAGGQKVGITALSHKVIRNLLERSLRSPRASALPCRVSRSWTNGPTSRIRPSSRSRTTKRPWPAYNRGRSMLWPARLGSGPGLSTSKRSMCCSSTRPGSYRSRTSSQSGSQPETSSCWAIPSSSDSRCRAAILRGPMSRRSSIS